MPDEEIGGEDGMKKFVLSQKFRDLNIGFAFDEGLAHPENVIQVIYGERSVWRESQWNVRQQITFHCYGKTGSLATPLNDTAGQKVRVILDRAMEFRQAQKEKLESDPSLRAGDVTSLNLTMMEGGASSLGNVPEQLSVTFDIRLAVTEDHEKMLAKLQSWCEEVGPETYYTFRQKDPHFQPTRIDNSNPWWLVFKAECNNSGLNIQPIINPPAGDSRHLRMVGVPSLGFAPMCNTPVRMHDHNEFLNEKVFLRGIRIYCRLLTAMANLAPSY
ncbi:hypothetical protein B7P43_G03992 [Cryptotermes secundus]|uniref:Peptidase M20 dimerisation domain-containing protein n=1 Tax=Cryptotermes secundus TaxID=105785 RepID=A0A2J7RCB2_9NEOP|nr:hypothetical protein B7P43_G03992 [Cryptotermes secundus]